MPKSNTEDQTAHATKRVGKDLPPAQPKTEAMRARLLERDARGKNTHHYTKAGDTNVGATIRRIQRELKENAAALQRTAATVCELKRKAKP